VGCGRDQGAEPVIRWAAGEFEHRVFSEGREARDARMLPRASGTNSPAGPSEVRRVSTRAPEEPARASSTNSPAALRASGSFRLSSSSSSTALLLLPLTRLLLLLSTFFPLLPF